MRLESYCTMVSRTAPRSVSTKEGRLRAGGDGLQRTEGIRALRRKGGRESAVAASPYRRGGGDDQRIAAFEMLQNQT